MRERDAVKVADALRRDFPALAPPTDFIWTAHPPLKVIDCVLSLNRQYDKVVLPRVHEFAGAHRSVMTCDDLRRLIDEHDSPRAFLDKALRTKDARRAETLSGVVDYVRDVQERFTEATEAARLERWARWARPGDHLAVGVPGFGLAGFQYLRMLFGAHTTKPDVHIKNYVAGIVGIEVTDVHALYVLERAAEITEQPLHWLDVAVWSKASRPGPSVAPPSDS